MMELINRARLGPSGEAARFGISLNEGLACGTISAAAKAPLAFDYDLSESWANHSFPGCWRWTSSLMRA